MANDAAESKALIADAQVPNPSVWHAELAQTYGRPKSGLGPFRHPHASSADVKFMEEHGAAHSAKDAEAVRAQVAKQGTDPEQALIKAAQSNRVVGFGDVHGVIGAHTEFLQNEMTKLKAAGVTHLAIEYPANEQTFIDQWDSTDKSIVRNSVKGKSSYTDVIDAAKRAGIKVVAVDKYSTHGENDPSRDQTMAQNIGNILKDPHAKVAFYVGANHLATGNNESTHAPSTAQLLRNNHISVDTFFPQVPTIDASLTPVAKDLTKPLSVETSGANLVAAATQETKAAYGRWDNVLFFPPGYGMEKMTSDLQRIGKNPQDELTAAVKNNRAVFLGEMERLDLSHSESPNKRFLGTEIPELKRAGLTDIGMNIPARYQDALNRYEKTGTMDKYSLPVDYSGEDFLSVMKAARSAGIKLHAIGQDDSYTPFGVAKINSLANSTADFLKNSPNAKMLVLSDAALVASYSDAGVVKQLAAKGIAAASFASLSADYMDPDATAVTQAIKAPTAFKPAQSQRLKELKTPIGEPLSLFDNVIVYPSKD